jgi:predicted ribosomally synthesized peptide with nif11-like leader
LYELSVFQVFREGIAYYTRPASQILTAPRAFDTRQDQKEVVMSLEQAKAFAEKMKSDKAFRDRIMAVKDVKERIARIKTEGFDCSETDLSHLKIILEQAQAKSIPGWTCCQGVDYYYREIPVKDVWQIF